MGETWVDKRWQADYVDLVVKRAKRRLTLAKARVRHLMEADFPSPGPVVLGHLILDLFDALIDKLNSLKDDLPLLGEDKIIPRAVDIMYMAGSLLEDVRILEQASIGRRQWALVEPIENMMQAIYPETSLVLSATSRYGYSYENLMERFEKIVAEALARSLVERVGPIYEVYPQYLVHLGFPSEERQEVLLCAGWAHELGHFIESVRHLSSPLRDDAIPEIIQSAAWTGQELEDLMTIATGWFEEIVSDVLAIRLFGPASMFAISSVILPHALLGEAGPSHPPFWVRLQAMLKALEEFGYRGIPVMPSGELGQLECEKNGDNYAANVARSVNGALKRSYEWLDTKAIRPEPAIVAADEQWKRRFEVVLATLEPRISDAVELVAEMRDDWFYSSQTYIDEVYPLVERLSGGLVPNEIYRGAADDQGGKWTPAQFPSILNAGWAYHLAFPEGLWREAPEERGMESELDHDPESALNDLLAKAVELSGFQLHFRERTGI